MDFRAVLQDVIVTICELPPELVEPSSQLEDLGIDSLAVAEILVELEIRLECELPVHLLRRLDQVTTVGDVADELARFVGAGASES